MMKKTIKEKELEECKKLKNEYLSGWKRARADFLNYKKQESERTNELIKYSNQEIIFKILSILDNLYIAEKQMPQDLKDNEWIKGLLQTKNQILDFLKIQGVEEIEPIKNFDPNFQEAIDIIEKKGEEPGIVIEEIKKGYIFEGKVIRPAQVKITK